MKKVYFATKNEGKIKETADILGFDVVGTDIKIDEIQSLDSKVVAIKKAKDYFKALKKPIFVEDVSLYFEALGLLPGTYINDFFEVLGNEGLIKLIENHKNKKLLAKTTIVYIENNNKFKVFEGEVKGKMSDKPKGQNGFGWDPIFIPEGSNKTFAQMNLKEKEKYSMRLKALKKFKKYLETKI